jgi:hypothetical protein
MILDLRLKSKTCQIQSYIVNRQLDFLFTIYDFRFTIEMQNLSNSIVNRKSSIRFFIYDL